MLLARALVQGSMAAASRNVDGLSCLDCRQPPLQQHLGWLLRQPRLLLLMAPPLLMQLQRRRRDCPMAYPCHRKPAQARASARAEQERPGGVQVCDTVALAAAAAAVGPAGPHA